MSLISILRGDNGQSTSESALLLGTQKMTAARAAATLEAAQKGQSAKGAPGAQITASARQAAAAKADADKPIATLLTETSKALKSDTPLRDLSNRALAAIALDETGAFSKEQAVAAKAELRGRDRASLVAAIGGSGLSAASVASWISAQTEARATMSSEEAALRAQDGRLFRT